MKNSHIEVRVALRCKVQKSEQRTDGRKHFAAMLTVKRAMDRRAERGLPSQAVPRLQVNRGRGVSEPAARCLRWESLLSTPGNRPRGALPTRRCCRLRQMSLPTTACLTRVSPSPPFSLKANAAPKLLREEPVAPSASAPSLRPRAFPTRPALIRLPRAPAWPNKRGFPGPGGVSPRG